MKAKTNHSKSLGRIMNILVRTRVYLPAIIVGLGIILTSSLASGYYYNYQEETKFYREIRETLISYKPTFSLGWFLRYLFVEIWMSIFAVAIVFAFTKEAQKDNDALEKTIIFNRNLYSILTIIWIAVGTFIYVVSCFRNTTLCITLLVGGILASVGFVATVKGFFKSIYNIDEV